MTSSKLAQVRENHFDLTRGTAYTTVPYGSNQDEDCLLKAPGRRDL